MSLFEDEELRLAADLVRFLKSHPLPSDWGNAEVKATFYYDGEESGLRVRKDAMGEYVVELTR